MLSILPTPIGNLKDLSQRVIEVLETADCIIAEDTRRTQQLLHHLNIGHKKLISFHDRNERTRLPLLLQHLQEGKTCALVTDAGTPSISDPGYRLIRSCLQESIPYTVLPGPSAVTTALVASGLPPLPFYFGGFLPTSRGKRRREIAAARARNCSSIYFETAPRILSCLQDFCYLPQETSKKATETPLPLPPNEEIFIGRELTKKFEQYYSGKPAELLQELTEHPPRGELTIVYHPSPPDPTLQETSTNGSYYCLRGSSVETSSNTTPILRNLA